MIPNIFVSFSHSLWRLRSLGPKLRAYNRQKTTACVCMSMYLAKHEIYFLVLICFSSLIFLNDICCCRCVASFSTLSNVLLLPICARILSSHLCTLSWEFARRRNGRVKKLGAHKLTHSHSATVLSCYDILSVSLGLCEWVSVVRLFSLSFISSLHQSIPMDRPTDR